MNLSLGEFQAATAKALRGAGYSWGMAAEGANACRTLASMGTDPSHNLLRLLQIADETDLRSLFPDETLRSPGGRVCPISLGAAISDAARTTPMIIDTVIEPLLLIPALSTITTREVGLIMHWEGGSVVIGRDGADAWALPPVADLRLEATPAPPPRPARASRIDVRTETLERLNRYAHRTYAPATAASREAGAGAGLNDND